MRMFLLCLLLGLATSLSLAQFEGILDMKMTSTGGGEMRSTTTSMMLKGSRIASTTGRDGKDVKVIFAGDKNLIWMIDDAKKSFTEISLDSMPAPAARAKTRQHATPHKSGKTATILGYSCDEWIVEDSTMETHLWATSKLGSLYEGFTKALSNLMNRGRGESGISSWQKDFIAMKAFPLKTERFRHGEPSETQEVTRLEEKSLPQSLFETPAGYTKQTLPTGMGKMLDQMRQQMLEKQKGGGAGEKPDIEKLMKEMQEKMKNLRRGGDGDSTNKEHN